MARAMQRKNLEVERSGQRAVSIDPAARPQRRPCARRPPGHLRTGIAHLKRPDHDHVRVRVREILQGGSRSAS